MKLTQYVFQPLTLTPHDRYFPLISTVIRILNNLIHHLYRILYLLLNRLER